MSSPLPTTKLALLCVLLPLAMLACGDDSSDGPGGSNGPGTTPNTSRDLIPTGYERANAPKLSPDGRFVAMIAEADDDARALVVYDLVESSAEVIVDQGLSYLSTIAWSADGAWLYYSGDGGIWRAPRAEPRTAEQVVNLFAVSGFDLSPDGSRLVWEINGSPDLRSLTLPAQLPAASNDAETIAQGRAPRFSPDGQRLLFLTGGSFGDDDQAYTILNLNDQTTTTLDAQGGYLSNGAWLNDDELLLLADRKIKRLNLTTNQAQDLADGFAAMNLDAHLATKRYVYATNGQRPVFLRGL